MLNGVLHTCETRRQTQPEHGIRRRVRGPGVAHLADELALIPLVEGGVRGLRDQHAPLPPVQALEVHPLLPAGTRARGNQRCGHTPERS